MRMEAAVRLERKITAALRWPPVEGGLPAVTVQELMEDVARAADSHQQGYVPLEQAQADLSGIVMRNRVVTLASAASSERVGPKWATWGHFQMIEARFWVHMAQMDPRHHDSTEILGPFGPNESTAP